MPSADKKQRQKKKREAKKRDLRRRESVSPVKRLADTPGVTEYWTSGDFGLRGQSEILVHKQAGGLTGFAAFLIDRGVVGLKDAYTRLGVSIGEFREVLDGSRDRGVPLTRTTATEAAAVIAGAIRWTRQNGMRLPKDWEKTVRILGPMPDIDTADVSKFVMEFEGHPEDLRQRLIGEPFDAFVKRKDVSILFSDEAPFKGSALHKLDVPDELYDEGDEDDDDGDDRGESGAGVAGDQPAEQLEEILRMTTPAATTLVEQTKLWLSARGEAASAELFEAWRSVLVAAALAKMALPNGSQKQVSGLAYNLIESLVGRIDEERVKEYDRALAQVVQHSQADPDVMESAIPKPVSAGKQS